MKLPRNQAQDLLWEDTCDELPGYRKEADYQVDTQRWVSVHELVIKDAEGSLWMTDYALGLTEYQDIEPFEDDDEVEFRAVEKVAVTTYEYRRKDG